MDDEAICALVTRLSRPHPSGGLVIERAAILAEGADFKAVLAWIDAHEGRPESAVAPVAGGGLHGNRMQRGSAPAPGVALRYVFPPNALSG